MKLYLNEYPRAFILVSDQYALIVRHPYPLYKYHHHHHHHHLHHHHHEQVTSDSSKSKSSKVIVEFVRKDSLNLSKYVDLTAAKGRAQNLSGFLGLLNVKDKLYLVFVSSAVTVATPRIDEDVQKITGVEVFCLNSDEFDWQFLKQIYTPVSSGTEDDYFELQSTDDKLLLTAGSVPSVRKLLSLGSFFFSHQFDVTSTIQERGFRDMQLPKFSLMGDLPYQRQFMWNSFLVSELIEFRGRLTPYEQTCFDSCGFLITITRGYAKTVNSTLGNGEEVLLTLISKQACAKNGPLFGDWGSDDNGHVSNFAESELVLFGSKFCLTYIMVRGNVPILWSLETHISKRTLAAKKNKKVVFPRSFEASQVAFTKHLDLLSNQYGDIHILNALSQDTKTYKGKLNITFKEHIKYFLEHRGNDEQTATNYKLGYTDMPVATSSMKKADYTAVNPHEYSQPIAKLVLNFGALFYDIDSRTYVGKQLGVFRVNSFDSLSKASFLCKIISQEVIQLAMRDLGIDAGHDLLSKHARLWAETDEYLRNITVNFVSYTDKLHSSSAASKGIVPSQLKKRYMHTVLDHKPGEMAILKLLGALQDQVSVSLHNPLHDYVTKELERREKEFTSQRDILVFASTFNVNASCEDQDKFKSWLFPPGSSGDYDLVFIGLQEIVELTASQMVDTDTLRRQMWEMHLRVCLETNNTTQSRYILLWSGQLGGIALFLFVKQLELKEIHDVEGSFKKTGFGGVSANKGAVAVRFNYSNTGLCLVASHFAAGHGNTMERHQNFKTIGKGIKFSKNRRIKDHDAVIWLGDFNYRINLPLEQVHALVEKKDFPRLFEYDQLNQQMASGESFPYFDEMELRFKPTYKFDNGTSTYDTSEKQRIPAWTDRILCLSRKKIIKQHLYDCSDEIKFSDHRPVYAVLSVSISVVNETVKKNLTHELYENYRKNYGDINDMIVTNTNLSFLISEADDNVLPPPSSDTTKWWLSNGRLAKITIPELSGPNADQLVFNPKYPHNPFQETEEPEFILRSELAQ